MGFWKTTGGLLWGATKLAGKAAAVTTIVAAKATVATARIAYENRETIAEVASGAAKVTWQAAKLAGKGTAIAAKAAYDNRESIAGATVGAVRGTVGVVRDLSGHLGADAEVEEQNRLLLEQGKRYNSLQEKVRRRIGPAPTKAVLLDTTLVGGETLATYMSMGYVPPELQRAYELAYPGLAADHSFIEEVRRLSADELQGFVSGLKGKLFELQYVDYLNDGHLPGGFHAELAHSATNPGWDIAIVGDGDSAMRDMIQLKATDSVDYVKHALEVYPDIDVVTTSEVHSHLVMQGFGAHVADSHISNHALTAAVEGGIDDAVGSMDWMPSVVSLAIIAFTAYNEEGLTNYQRSRNFGERSMKSYVAYLAGGGLAVATGLWWVGVLGGIGSRVALGSGRAKNERVEKLKTLVRSNEVILARMERPAILRLR